MGGRGGLGEQHTGQFGPWGVALLCGLREVQIPLWASISLKASRVRRPTSLCGGDAVPFPKSLQ